MKDFKKIFEKTKGQLVNSGGTIGVVAGYASDFLIAATTEDNWKENSQADDACIDEEYLNKGYSFMYIEPKEVHGYSKKSITVTMLTLDELQKNPKVRFGFNAARQVTWVDHTDGTFIINNGMLKHFGKPIELTRCYSGYEDIDGYGYEPWMYKKIC